ncbi:hypothetical protein [Gordonia alkanivorans]|uniref:hypothetical protein n=1 Tax=Gordonia alkanivorans TaxID=84096 RepID=UPI0004B7CA4F|nr:hypothetical protein [Gordonia alkanivorans]
MTLDTTDRILTAIATADAAQLAQIRQAIEHRTTALQQERINALPVGARVVIGNEVRPRYISGLPGTVHSRLRGKRIRVEIDLETLQHADERVRKFLREGKFLDTPEACIVPVA